MECLNRPHNFSFLEQSIQFRNCITATSSPFELGRNGAHTSRASVFPRRQHMCATDKLTGHCLNPHTCTQIEDKIF